MNPLHAVKLFQDYMLKAKELALRVKEAKQKHPGTGGGIRVVLLNPVATTRTATDEPAPCGPVKAQPLVPNSEDAFDPAELIEDFEHPICQFCIGVGWVRDANGINMVTCVYCEGKGRAPAPE